MIQFVFPCIGQAIGQFTFPHGGKHLNNNTELLARTILCCNQLVFVFSRAGGSWFSSEADIEIYEWRKAKTEALLRPRPDLP